MINNYLGEKMHTVKLSIYEQCVEYWMVYKWQEGRKEESEGRKIKEQRNKIILIAIVCVQEAISIYVVKIIYESEETEGGIK